MSLQRVPIYSPNYSSREGRTVRLIVLHTSEGATTYGSLGSFFSHPSSAVSSHVGIDDTPNVVGEYVLRGYKAWTSSNANPVAVQAELCTPNGAAMGWTPDDWAKHPTMLSNTAQWIKEESEALGIPIVRLSPAAAQSTGFGVCQHSDLGAWGGGHTDCGPAFPIDQVIEMALGYTPPSPPVGGEHMVLTDPVSGGVWVCDPTSKPPGAVYSYDGAPYLGATNNSKMNALSYPLAGIGAYKDPNGQQGYVIVLDFGEGTGGDRFRRYRFPRNGSGKV